MKEARTNQQDFWPLLKPLDTRLATKETIGYFSTDGKLIASICQSLMNQAGADALALVLAKSEDVQLRDFTIQDIKRLSALRGYCEILRKIKYRTISEGRSQKAKLISNKPKSAREMGRIKSISDFFEIYKLFRPAITEIKFSTAKGNLN